MNALIFTASQRMMRGLGGLAVLCMAGALWAATPVRFGIIEWATGPAEIINANGQARPARASEPVLSGETVQTGPGGELHVRTEDSAFVAFRQNTQVRIDSYLATGGAEDNFAVSLLRGAMRSVTGWLGRKNPAAYRVRTPTATVGIRGTDHETHYVPPHPGTDANLPAPGTYDKVNSGGTTLRNMGGQIDIGPNQSAHAPNDGRTAPRVLDRAPNIFRPGMNDSRIEMRKMELAREIEARLQERPGSPKDLKELKELKDAKDAKDGNEAKDVRDAKDAKEAKGADKDDARKAAERKRRKPGER
jgi:hypothetical protein